MKKNRAYVILLLCFSVLNLLSQNNLKQLTPAQLQEDFQLLRYHLENVHPGLYTYTPKEKMDEHFDQVSSSLNVSMNTADFFKELLPLLKPIGNNHTKIEPSPDYIEYLRSEALRFPFRLYYGKDALFIFTDESNENSIGNGKLLKSINGVAAMDLLNQFADLRPTDGYNRSYPLFGASYRFSRYYAYQIGHPKSFVIEYFEDSGQLKKETIKALTVSEILANMKKRITSQPVLKDEDFAFKVIDGIAVLRIRSFQPQGKGAGAKYKRLLKESFASIRKEGIQKLVLDIRGNGGGFPEATWELLSYIVDNSIIPHKDEYALVKEVPQAQYYEDADMKHFKRLRKVKRGEVYEIKGSIGHEVKPKPTAFKGQLYILMNELCASATSEFIGQVKANTNAIFIGGEPGGNSVIQVANDLPVLVLPHSKIKATIPLVKSEMNVNWENDGYGVKPDYEIVPTVEELLAQEDRLLKKVLDLIKNGSLIKEKK